MSDLLDQLRSPSEDVRRAAIATATGCSDPAVVQALIQHFSRAELSESERQLAAEALGKCTMPEISAKLLPMLASESPFHRTMAAAGLGGQRDAATITALVRGLTDPVNTVRNWAERSLLGLIPDVQQHGVEALIGLLSHEVRLSRSPAARVLGLTQDERALAPLQHMAEQDADWLARMAAVKALGDLGFPQSIDLVTRALQSDPKNRVRAAAAEALGKLRPDNAEQLLRTAMQTDEDEGLQKSAGEALRSLGFEVTEINDDGWE
jgi:HEAT repeat protein